MKSSTSKKIKREKKPDSFRYFKGFEILFQHFGVDLLVYIPIAGVKYFACK